MEAVVSGRLPQVLTLNPATLTLVSEEEVAAEAVVLSSPVLTSCLHPCTTAVLVPVLVPLEGVAELRLSPDLHLEGEVPSPLDLKRELPVLEEVAGLRLSRGLRLEGEVPSPMDLTRVLPVKVACASHWACAVGVLVRARA